MGDHTGGHTGTHIPTIIPFLIQFVYWERGKGDERGPWGCGGIPIISHHNNNNINKGCWIRIEWRTHRLIPPTLIIIIIVNYYTLTISPPLPSSPLSLPSPFLITIQHQEGRNTQRGRRRNLSICTISLPIHFNHQTFSLQILQQQTTQTTTTTIITIIK